MTEEVDKAGNLGYIILEKYEAWHFPASTQYDNQSKTGGIWAECTKLRLKHKQEASDWPDWCRIEENKQRYVEEYLHHEDVQLEPDDIQKNDGLRSLAKLLLNSMWGKMGQSPKKSKNHLHWRSF